MAETIRHEAVIKRLKRAQGHLKSVIEMMEAGRPCMEVAQQLHAVVGALENAKVEFMESIPALGRPSTIRLRRNRFCAISRPSPNI